MTLFLILQRLVFYDTREQKKKNLKLFLGTASGAQMYHDFFCFVLFFVVFALFDSRFV